MRLREAQPADLANLNDFFYSFPIAGPLEIHQRRFKSFERVYQTQGFKSRVFVFENEKQQIEGVASFVICDCLLDHHIRRVAFARDLRIKQSRQAIVSWTSFFLPTMREIQKEEKVDFFFACISDYELLALNSFVRSRSLDKPIPRYSLFAKWNLVSLHGFWPFARNPLPHLSFQSATEVGLDRVMDFYLKDKSPTDLNPLINRDAFLRLLREWPNLQASDFVVLVNRQREIVGGCCLWTPNGVVQYELTKMTGQAANFSNLLHLLKVFGLARPLTSFDAKNRESLNFRQMAFIECRTPDVFETLVWHCYHNSPQREFLVYGHTQDKYSLRPPSSCISSSWPFGIYTMIPPEDVLPGFLRPNHGRDVQFEPFFAL